MRAAGISDLQSCYVKHCDEAQAVSLTFPTGFKFSYSGDCRPSKMFAQVGKDSTVLLHEATFDDELGADAISKKHSTTSEAIGVGVAMGARRILLTHFSQRYQKLPIMSNVQGLGFKFEGGLDAGDEIDGRTPDIASVPSGSAELDVSVTQSHTSADPELATSEVGSTLPQVTPEMSSVLNNQTPSDLKIGVAFDYMRVKVGDIIHLEKFTPALLKLFEGQEPEKPVEMHEEDMNDKNAEKGKSSLTPNTKHPKSKAEKKAGNKAGNKPATQAGEGTKKKSTDEARSQAAYDEVNTEKDAVPKNSEGEESIQPLAFTEKSISM